MTLVQDLHAAISRRDWHAVEVAANRLRDANLEADNAAKDARVKELELIRDSYAQDTLQAIFKQNDLETQLAAARKALEATHEAISEYYRYQTGGETRGSYDGKPERNSLWKSMYQARTALEASHGE
ncbi:hypothetical protein LQT97_14965 [Brucella pseudogrignonensis]|uniref:hypothetical protein n=1 Tax=Brucella pseudogrignonensis TaxID=419475 RepID=UPI001E33B695|nr:hypothetical protein [Brucella pseudogrignonensis]MCD4512526.1 hypothetical protein [Brucella pseudogrignonensis]